MKKIIMLLIIVLSWVHVTAQDVGSYNMNISISIFDVQNNHSSSCENRFDFHITYPGVDSLRWHEDLDGVSNDASNPTHFEKNFKISASRPLNGVYFFGTRGWRNAFTCNDSDDIGTTVSLGTLAPAVYLPSLMTVLFRPGVVL